MTISEQDPTHGGDEQNSVNEKTGVRVKEEERCNPQPKAYLKSCGD